MANSRKWRADKLIRQVEDAQDVLAHLDRATILELIRRGEESSEIDGYSSNSGYDRVGSGGTRVIEVDGEEIPLDSSTEAAAFRRLGDSRADPLMEAINRVFEIVESVAKDLKEADRKRMVVMFAADGRRGRESSLQGNCSVCGDPVAGVGDDRLRRGLDPKCWVSWTRWKLENASSGDPGQDFQRFTAWRSERLNTTERAELTA